MNWHVIYTKPQCKDSVAFFIRNAGIEAICTTIRFRKYTPGSSTYITELLFKRYILACSDNDKYNHMIRYTQRSIHPR